MLKKSNTPIHIIGGGLAGCEASWQIAQSGIPVIVHEMRPKKNPMPIKPISLPNWSVQTHSVLMIPQQMP